MKINHDLTPDTHVATSSRTGSKSLHKYAAGVFALATFATTFALATGPAEAAAISGAITAVDTVQTAVSDGWEVSVTCSWRIPDGSKQGDTFDLQLPPELRWNDSSSIQVKDAAGNVIATAVPESGGKVVFTLTDYAQSHTNVRGGCRFSTLFQPTTTPGSTVDLDFTVGSDIYRKTVDYNAPCEKDCNVIIDVAVKTSAWKDPKSKTEISSGIKAPRTTEPTNTVVITDTPGPGMVVDCSAASYSAAVGPNLNGSGAIIAPNHNDRYPALIDCSPTRITATWVGVPAGEYTQLWLTSKITDPSLERYTNNGSVSINGVSSPVTTITERNTGGGNGDGDPTPSPTPTPTSPTPTPTPTPATPTSTPTTPASVPTKPAVPAGPKVETGGAGGDTSVDPTLMWGLAAGGAATVVLAGSGMAYARKRSEK